MNAKVFAECMKRNMDKQGITTEALSERMGMPPIIYRGER